MSPITVRLEQLAEQTGQALENSAGGQSLCGLHKRGDVSQGLKFCEGQDFVARKMLKAAGSDSAGAELEGPLAALERKFQAFRDSPVLTSPDWQAYAQGGLDMVARIRAILDED